MTDTSPLTEAVEYLDKCKKEGYDLHGVIIHLYLESKFYKEAADHLLSKCDSIKKETNDER